MFSSKNRFSVTASGLISTPRNANRVSAAMATGAHKQTANLAPFMMNDFGGGASSRIASTTGMSTTFMLTGIVPEHEEVLRRYYRDMYLHDPVCGSAVDLMSSFPFSDWTLTGATREQLHQYDESLSRLNIRSLLPETSVSYLVDAEFIGTLIFNRAMRVFIDVMVHGPEFCRKEGSPFYSLDPTITVTNSDATRKFMASNSPQARAMRDLFSDQFVNALNSSAFELNPHTTLYLARRTLPSKPPISYLKRALPIYLLERTLYRGTLTEATKRQRAMAHITAGSDSWEPTPEELDALVGAFQMAEVDPLGAIVATRNDVQISEARQGGDFWKWTDAADSLTPLKLRALGVSEAFLSGDASYSNGETAMSVFMDNADMYRQYMTYKIFTNRIFPIVAVSNGFYRNESKGKRDASYHNQQFLLNNQQNLVIPKVSWEKSLETRADKDPMEVLEKLEEKGFPIPLRMWAAAGKVTMETLLYELDQDKDYRDMISKFKEMTGQSADSSVTETEDLELSSVPASMRRRKVPLLSRKFSERDHEVYATTRTGKPKYVIGQRKAQAEANSNMVKAIKRLADPNVRAAASERASKLRK